jgi:hypothetical protein
MSNIVKASAALYHLVILHCKQVGLVLEEFRKDFEDHQFGDADDADDDDEDGPTMLPKSLVKRGFGDNVFGDVEEREFDSDGKPVNTCRGPPKFRRLSIPGRRYGQGSNAAGVIAVGSAAWGTVDGENADGGLDDDECS